MPGELARMASIWRIDGVFSDMRIEEMGTRFHENRTSGCSLFCDHDLPTCVKHQWAKVLESQNQYLE